MLTNSLQGSLERLSDKRGAERYVLRLAAAIDARPESAITVHNLSRTGMLITSETALTRGEAILVEFAGGAGHNAEVVWADDKLFGCRFIEPLSRAALSAALLRAWPVGPPSRREDRKPRLVVPSKPVADAMTPRAKAAIIAGLALAGWICVAGSVYVIAW